MATTKKKSAVQAAKSADASAPTMHAALARMRATIDVSQSREHAELARSLEVAAQRARRIFPALLAVLALALASAGCGGTVDASTVRRQACGAAQTVCRAVDAACGTSGGAQ